MSKKCTRCRAIYEKPAEKPQKNGMVLLACPRCGCHSYTRVSGPTLLAADKSGLDTGPEVTPSNQVEPTLPTSG